MVVDSIQHTDTIRFGAIIEILFYAHIGPIECYEFSVISPEFDSTNIQLLLISNITSNQGCGETPQYLNGKDLGISGLTIGEYTIKVMQPDGYEQIASTVFVKE